MATKHEEHLGCAGSWHHASMEVIAGENKTQAITFWCDKDDGTGWMAGETKPKSDQLGVSNTTTS